MPRTSHRLAVLAALIVAPSLSAQIAPRAPQAPLPPVRPHAPLPPQAPLPPAAPLPFEIDAREIAEFARARAEMAIDLARLSTTDAVALAMDGQRLAMEGQRLAASMPSVRFDAQTWSGIASTRSYRTVAPEAWDAQDPADSLYRDARKALTGESYQRAAELFRQIRQKYPKSSYAPDAPYWEAFALQRLGGQQNLNLAQDALGLQQRDYPRAATRGDAAALNARIEAQLGRRGNVVAAQSVMGRAERAANDGCPRADEDERVDALNAVTQMDAERAMPILKKVLARREPCTQQLRRTAVMLVARQKNPEAASLLMSSAKNDPDREVREQAVFWLANVPTEEAVNMLIDLARNGEEIELRKRAVYALSRAKSEKAVNTLRELAADSKAPEELRMEAFSWYLSSQRPTTGDQLPFLKTMYANVSSDGMRHTVLRYIAGIRSEEARTFLTGIALNDRESLDVRRGAVQYLQLLGGLSVTTGPRSSRDSSASARSARSAEYADIARALWQVYEKSDELEIRRQVLSSLSRVGDNAGIDKLIDVARTEKNIELRRSAISYLSRSKDPRAIELLQEIINK